MSHPSQKRADSDEAVSKALKACTEAVAPLTGGGRLRVVAGLRAFIQSGGPFDGNPGSTTRDERS